MGRKKQNVAQQLPVDPRELQLQWVTSEFPFGLQARKALVAEKKRDQAKRARFWPTGKRPTCCEVNKELGHGMSDQNRPEGFGFRWEALRLVTQRGVPGKRPVAARCSSTHICMEMRICEGICTSMWRVCSCKHMSWECHFWRAPPSSWETNWTPIWTRSVCGHTFCKSFCVVFKSNSTRTGGLIHRLYAF